MTFFSTPTSFCPEKHLGSKVEKWLFRSTIGIPGTELSMGPKSIPNWSPPIGGPNMGWGLGYPKMRVFGLTESHSLCLLRTSGTLFSALLRPKSALSAGPIRLGLENLKDTFFRTPAPKIGPFGGTHMDLRTSRTRVASRAFIIARYWELSKLSAEYQACPSTKRISSSLIGIDPRTSRVAV